MTNMMNNRINFGSKPLHQVNLRSDLYSGFVPAVLSELDPKDEGDLKTLEELNEAWKTEYTQDILDLFKKPNENNIQYYHHTLGIKRTENPDKKILGVLSTKFNSEENAFKILRLQVHPKYTYLENAQRLFKGIGETLVGKAFSLANNLKTPWLSFGSSVFVKDFYEKIFNKANIKNHGAYYAFDIAAPDLPKFLEYIQKKYKTTF